MPDYHQTAVPAGASRKLGKAAVVGGQLSLTPESGKEGQEVTQPARGRPHCGSFGKPQSAEAATTHHAVVRTRRLPDTGTAGGE